MILADAHVPSAIEAGLQLPTTFVAQRIHAVRPGCDAHWVECLVRGQGPMEGVSPMELVRLGYESRGVLFDRDVITQCLRDGRSLPRNCWLSINVHPCSLHRNDFFEFVLEACESSGIGPERVVFELVEFDGPVNLMASRRVLEALRAEGVRFALDDFGPGFSNIDLVAGELIDFVKLDRSLVRFVDSHPGYSRLLQGMQSLADHTGVSLVAEGVETEEQARVIAEHGVEWIQGFLHGRPEPLRAVRAVPAGAAR